MSDIAGNRVERFHFDPLSDPALYDAIRPRRLLAFLIDAVVILVLCIIGSIALFFLGFLTFGLAWLGYAILWPVVALFYNVATLGGPKAATPGMQAMGLQMRLIDASPMTPTLAAAHAVLFYFSWTILTPLILLVTFFNERKRLLHDILIGAVVVNARTPGLAPLPRNQ